MRGRESQGEDAASPAEREGGSRGEGCSVPSTVLAGKTCILSTSACCRRTEDSSCEHLGWPRSPAKMAQEHASSEKMLKNPMSSKRFWRNHPGKQDKKVNCLLTGQRRNVHGKKVISSSRHNPEYFSHGSHSLSGAEKSISCHCPHSVSQVRSVFMETRRGSGSRSGRAHRSRASGIWEVTLL